MEDNYFVDTDGERYKVIRLNDGNIWFAESLRRNIPGSHGYEGKKGRYYSGSNVHQAIPSGWSIPSIKDWKNLYKVHGELPKELNVGDDGLNGHLSLNSTTNQFEPDYGNTIYFLTGRYYPEGFLGFAYYGLTGNNLMKMYDKDTSMVVRPYGKTCEGGNTVIRLNLSQVRCFKKA